MGRQISIWGATGSIGTQTLDVIARNPDRFRIHTLTTHSNPEPLLRQASRFRPRQVVITGPCDRPRWEAAFRNVGVSCLFDKSGLLEAAASPVDLAVNALVGAVGLEATLLAVDAGADIALANKEVLVMAGELVVRRIRRQGVRLLPVDSEHSAIFQCLAGEPEGRIRRILLTASGGPFLNRPASEFESITPEEALAHPNWVMGKKVTIDSSTLMNKGLEVIEARWLFDLRPEQITVVIHPQSIVHSMVEFEDGSIKAQLGQPDMRVPIAYALSFPDRWEGPWGSQDFSRPFALQFQPPDLDRFPGLRLAFAAIETGGTAPAVFNAADEVAVALFLDRKIRYPQIAELVERALDAHGTMESPDLEQILRADRETRERIWNEYGHP
ncbi:MAG TPA: 1-deoxy-D-xylulose-5-phosphate reductoisomerase [bacterium]|nr:1-deoxy-D-xylulose-5-phosphate reductoisomerase [bacterium]